MIIHQKEQMVKQVQDLGSNFARNLLKDMEERYGLNQSLAKAQNSYLVYQYRK